MTQAPSLTDFCIVCPHTRADHKYDERTGQTWCGPCNKDEMSGPCSFFFIPRHEFNERIIHTGECRVCKLGRDHMAHDTSD